MATYRTFKRSCRNWKEFAEARKITVDRGLTEADAIARCKAFNDNLSSRQRARGTKLEYTQE